MKTSIKSIKTKKKSNQKLNYKQSGVDVEAGDALVDWIAETRSPQIKKSSKIESTGNLVAGVGGFASVWKLGSRFKKPCIVTCTDGVGTKVKLASFFKDYESVGQDLVAMCVNDLICTGATPVLFLDYYASGKLNLPAAKSFLTGVRRACAKSGALLVGGETAEMPGVYHNNDFDCAGFAVGLVEEDEILGAHRVQVGDMVLGVSSSGFHSNGFSLLRKVFAHDLKKNKKILLEPTALYPELFNFLKKKKVKLKAMAHITGGGMENLPRVLPKDTKVRLIPWSFTKPYLEVQKRSGLTREEMLKTFNCGVGLALVISPKDLKKVNQWVQEKGFGTHLLGLVEKAKGEAHVEYP
ncbi:MAG TPA: phosphoribosylformylglycinamidine cyclo-ligase [Pseudobdellovibrionaceae bacterium]|nr:phosphoribosylformylglycinamidine cyclo-ligase [Pseudobdellovibrionaceae bacterium]